MVRQNSDSLQALRGDRRSRLHSSDKIMIERRDTDGHDHKIQGGELSQDIDIPLYECILRDNGDRIEVLQEDFETLTRDLQFPLDRLVTVCVT